MAGLRDLDLLYRRHCRCLRSCYYYETTNHRVDLQLPQLLAAYSVDTREEKKSNCLKDLPFIMFDREIGSGRLPSPSCHRPFSANLLLLRHTIAYRQVARSYRHNTPTHHTTAYHRQIWARLSQKKRRFLLPQSGLLWGPSSPLHRQHSNQRCPPPPTRRAMVAVEEAEAVQ